MKPLDKGLAFVLVALVASQVASQRGCSLPIDITPEPKASEVWAVLIEETSDREPWLGQLIVQTQNTELSPHEFKSLDKSDLPDWAVKVTDDMIATPAIVFLNAETKHTLGTMPVTKETTVEQIKGAIAEYAN